MAFKRTTTVYSFFHSILVFMLSFDITFFFYVILTNGKHICKKFVGPGNPSWEFPEKTQSGVNIMTFSIRCHQKAPF